MKYRRAEGMIEAAIGAEIVLLDIDKGKYHHLSETTSVLWTSLAQPQTLDDILVHLERCFVADPVEIRMQVESFLDTDQAREIIIRNA